jgi:predicted enzyme related to lactoylglutathione lyase
LGTAHCRIANRQEVNMLANAMARATVPAEDVGRATKFYTESLGLKKVDGSDQYSLFEAGKGSQILMYKRGRTKAEHTEITFVVDDLENEVKRLTEKGVKMEQYDMGPIKTNEKGIATMGDVKMAWMTDTEGNILGLSSM